MHSRIVGSLLTAALLVAACSSPPSKPTVIPLIVSSEQTVGSNRFLFSLLDAKTNVPVASPDRPVSVTFTDPAGASSESADARFIWAIEGSRGVYVTEPTFGQAGTWEADFTTTGTSGTRETIEVGFDVREEGTTVAVGEQAPIADTPTLADVGGAVAAISTDPNPNPAFYEHSVADLLVAGTPFVLVFATPKFCTSAQCGPTLERVKAIAAQRPDFTFVNVEPYELVFVDGSLQPRLSTAGQLQPVEATNAFGLLTEPYVFVVNGNGTIAAAFELIFSDEELLAAIDAAA